MKTLSLLTFVLTCAMLHAADDSGRKNLEEFLPKWTEAWNSADIGKLIDQYHPDNKGRIAFNLAPTKEMVTKAFSEQVAAYGKIKSATVGKLIAASSKYVVKIEYEKKGVVPGTMELKKDLSGNWKVIDFNISGQGEPELKE